MFCCATPGLLMILFLLFSLLLGAIQAIWEQTFDCCLCLFLHSFILLRMLDIGMPHEALFVQVGWYRLIGIFIFPYHKLIVVFILCCRLYGGCCAVSLLYFFVICFYVFPSYFLVKDHHGHQLEDAATDFIFHSYCYWLAVTIKEASSETMFLQEIQFLFLEILNWVSDNICWMSGRWLTVSGCNFHCVWIMVTCVSKLPEKYSKCLVLLCSENYQILYPDLPWEITFRLGKTTLKLIWTHVSPVHLFRWSLVPDIGTEEVWYSISAT